MNRRTRKFVGTAAILAFVIFYAFFASAVGQHLIPHDSAWIELLYFTLAGLAWVLPVMPVIRWMERPDPEEARSGR